MRSNADGDVAGDRFAQSRCPAGSAHCDVVLALLAPYRTAGDDALGSILFRRLISD